MRNIIHTLSSFAVLATLMSLVGCSSGGDFQGLEYMPDMGHSIAYEANYSNYYGPNTPGTKEEYREMAGPRTTVKGTIPRGKNKYQPYYLMGTSDSIVAVAETFYATNPVSFTDELLAKKGLDKGKNLYNIYCAVCHGKKGDGNGPIYDDGNGPYTAGPANYLDQGNFGKSKAGRYYHAIMRGKGAMLSHADKLNFEERWLVIHYINSLQHKAWGGEGDYAKVLAGTQTPKAVANADAVANEEENVNK